MKYIFFLNNNLPSLYHDLIGLPSPLVLVYPVCIVVRNRILSINHINQIVLYRTALLRIVVYKIQKITVMKRNILSS